MNPKTRPVRDIKIPDGEKTGASDLIEQMMEGGGFTAKKLAIGVDVISRMLDSTLVHIELEII
jgi:deoxyhypusine synthase